MSVYKLTKQQKDALKTRNAIQAAKDRKKPEVLTKEQAHARWPDRGYNVSTVPCVVVAGTAASIKKHTYVKSILVVETINGDVEIPLRYAEKISDASWDNIEEDVSRRNDTRYTVWKDDEQK